MYLQRMADTRAGSRIVRKLVAPRTPRRAPAARGMMRENLAPARAREMTTATSARAQYNCRGKRRAVCVYGLAF